MQPPSALLLAFILLLAGCVRSELPEVDASPTPVEPTTATVGEEPPSVPERALTLIAAEGPMGPVWRDDRGREDPAILLEAGVLIDITIVIEDGGVHAFALDGRTLTPIPTITTTLQAVMPLEGGVTYACPIHPTTMVGEIRVAPGHGALRFASVAEPRPVEADVPSATHVSLAGHTQSGGSFFTAAGTDVRDPTIAVPANVTVVVELAAASGVHNIAVPGLRSTFVGEGDEPVRVTFESGPDGVMEYWCDPHKGSGMRGRIFVGAISPYLDRIVDVVDVSELPASRELAAGEILLLNNPRDSIVVVALQHKGGQAVRELAPREGWAVEIGGEGALHVTSSVGDVRMIGLVSVT